MTAFQYGSCLLIFLLAAGCAALRAPVEFEAPSDSAGDAQRALVVEAVEGRPNGLLLRLSCRCESTDFALPDDGWLELLRSQPDGRIDVFRRVRLQPKLREQLSKDGLEFLDRSVQAGEQVAYQLRALTAGDDGSEEPLGVSAPLEVTWQKPPPKPKGVRASSSLAGWVELAWKPAHGGALVFRRDVLDPQAPTQRVGALEAAARGVFVDRDVEPGGVYAYRVALAIDEQGLLQFGAPSDEIYVTVAAAPTGDDADTPR